MSDPTLNTTTPLGGMLIVDLSSGLAGGYCTKVLADGGATVVKVEAPEGDHLRRSSPVDPSATGEDGALFQSLACSKRSVVVDPCFDPDLAFVCDLVLAADAVVWSAGSRVAELDELRPEALHCAAPAAIIAAISPFGLTGPWADRPATELTLQAWSGGAAVLGAPDRPPVACGGRPGQWLGGLMAAIGVLTAYQRTLVTGVGELVDVSILETLAATLCAYPVTARTERQSVFPEAPLDPASAHMSRSVNIPAIERAMDGWVGFMVATAPMWQSFCVLVEHPEWANEERLYSYAGRRARRGEIEAAVRDWVGRHTVAEVLELAELLRVPAAPVGNGASVFGFDHFVERSFYVRNPRGGFLQPDVPYTMTGASARRRPLGLPPRLGEHTDDERKAVRRSKPAGTEIGAPPRLPFEGVRVADFTSYLAGPIVGNYLALLGAEVIHVESPTHPDGMRGHSVKTTDDDRWWEYTPFFHGANTNKKGVTIDMATDRGRHLARRLISECDIMVENYSPRVLEHWGLEYETVRGIREDIILLRCPAFGLTGPWRNRTGYAQTMEQVSGLAWVTGFADGPPVQPNGLCDPVAALHATAALLLAIEHRRRTGEGMQVEVSMVGGALNITAEQVVDYMAYGHLMERKGNRGIGAPQNFYLTADLDALRRRDCWVAIAIESDAHWKALQSALGHPPWAEDPALATPRGRRAAQDRLDSNLAEWCETRSGDDIVDLLWPYGVPVAKVVVPVDIDSLPQHAARGFFQKVAQPLVGDVLHAGCPIRFSTNPELVRRSPAPMLGQHNREVFRGLLGLSEAEFSELEDAHVIGTTLIGEHGTR